MAEPSETVKDYESTDIWVTQSKTIPNKCREYVSSSSVGWWTYYSAARHLKAVMHGLPTENVYGHPQIGPVYSIPVWFSETSIDDLITDSEFNTNFEKAEADIAKHRQISPKAKTDILSNASEINTVKLLLPLRVHR